MKKIMVLLAVTMFLLGVSGQAMAAFSTGDLIQVVYQSGGTYEVATDLGAFAPTSTYSGPTINLNTNPSYGNGAFAFSTPGAGGVFNGTTLSNLNVAYFVWGGGTTTEWLTGPTNSGQASAYKQAGTFSTAATNLTGLYSSVLAGTNTGSTSVPYSANGTMQVQVGQGDLSSYWSKMDKGGTNGAVGSYAGLVTGGGQETNLGNSGTNNYVDSYLYYYSNANAGQAGTLVADIRTFTNGTAEVVGTAPTPVPPSILLMGSGLLGLVGIRRKHAA